MRLLLFGLLWQLFFVLYICFFSVTRSSGESSPAYLDMHFVHFVPLLAYALAVPVPSPSEDCDENGNKITPTGSPDAPLLPESAFDPFPMSPPPSGNDLKGLDHVPTTIEPPEQELPTIEPPEQEVPQDNADELPTNGDGNDRSTQGGDTEEDYQLPPHDISTAPTAPTHSFSSMVVFGDSLSDDGNGLYAHGLTDPSGENPKVYGFGTWTNGPVAASYLSDMLEIPQDKNYAFGRAEGGSQFGATIDNDYTQSSVPSSKDQIEAYVSSSPASISDTLHFLWIGSNDINLFNVDTDQPTSPTFAKDFSSRLCAQVQTLLSAGAQNIFVPNLYPKHLSRSAEFIADTPGRKANLGSIIKEANDAIASELAQFGNQVVVYDVFSRMVEIWNNHDQYGIHYTGNHVIDGGTQEDWDLYLNQAKGDEFYWMQFIDPTTVVHKLVAEDMRDAIASRYGS